MNKLVCMWLRRKAKGLTEKVSMQHKETTVPTDSCVISGLQLCYSSKEEFIYQFSV